MPKSETAVTVQPIVDAKIYTVRGQSVMLDSDLAEVYQVDTKAVNRAVQRNIARFPGQLSFQLQENEWDALRRQIGTLKLGRGQHRKYLPRVFTEHGAVMLASVLNSPRAIQASLAVIDAFVRLRHILDANKDLATRVAELSERVDEHDESIGIIFEELEDMVTLGIPLAPKERIGYKSGRGRQISSPSADPSENFKKNKS